MRNLFFVLKSFNPLLHPRNPDGTFTTRGLFDLQNSLVESQPKHMENRAYGKALEHAGDIFRELTMYNEIKPFSKGYTDEKIRRLRSMLNDDEFSYPLSPGDMERVSSMERGWDKILPNGGIVSDAKDLALLVLKRSRKEALRKLAEIDTALTKFYA